MQILCTIPTATSPINGHPFEPHELGLIGDVPDELGESLLTIPGYQLPPTVSTSDPDAPELDALRAQAEALGIAVKGTWREARLRAEIERAQAAQAAQVAS